ncbi:Cytochrome P [Parasponia andersonii]|uniref:Cytochrome P n=1 Tax=Parasponia andersonii TaxID=3476 RepID=A0A2P5D904_PARAD|nr:Cytochrome P [Parasponia andersonii]
MSHLEVFGSGQIEFESQTLTVKALIKDMIKEREKALESGEANNDDLLSVLLESNLKEIQENRNKKNVDQLMSIDDIFRECKLFYFAGQDTTSVLLVWTMVLLSINPDWQARARDEVLQVFGTKKPDYEGLTHLKVAECAIYS